MTTIISYPNWARPGTRAHRLLFGRGGYYLVAVATQPRGYIDLMDHAASLDRADPRTPEALLHVAALIGEGYTHKKVDIDPSPTAHEICNTSREAWSLARRAALHWGHPTCQVTTEVTRTTLVGALLVGLVERWRTRGTPDAWTWARHTSEWCRGNLISQSHMDAMLARYPEPRNHDPDPDIETTRYFDHDAAYEGVAEVEMPGTHFMRCARAVDEAHELGWWHGEED